MATDPMLENYLARLERILQPIPVSDRAEIVTEIKSHVLEALERGDPKPTLESVLASLGTPEQVANRYLLERRIPMTKPPIHSAVKWLFGGCFLMLALILTLVGAITWKVLDTISWEELKKHNIRIGDGQVEIRATTKDTKVALMEKSYVLAPEDKNLKISLRNGAWSLQTSENDSLHVSCEVSRGSLPETLSKTNDGVALLSLEELPASVCELAIPKGRLLQLTAGNGAVAIEEPLFSVEAALGNSVVNIDPKKGIRYAWDLQVGLGTIDDEFVSDANPEYKINIKVGNGSIAHE